MMIQLHVTIICNVMRLTIISPTFIPYSDDSPFSTVYLCQQIGEALISKGHRVCLFGLQGSKSSIFDVRVIEGEFQPNILSLKEGCSASSGLMNIVSIAMDYLEHGRCDAVINFGHDALPYSINKAGFLNVVTFGRGVDADIDYALSTSINAGFERFGFLSESQASSYGISTKAPLYCPVTMPNSHALQSGSGSLLFAGRVTHSKGISRAIKIARRARRVLAIAGQCDEDMIVQMIDEFELADYKGCLPRDDLYSLMRSSSVMLQLQTGEAEEAFGMVTAEALCCGLPVVTWPCGANTELVIDGEDGVVIPYKNISAAENAVHIAAGWSVDKRESIRKRALSRFSVDAVAARYEAWIEQNIR